ncbi:MAG: hypothetical protein GC145_17170 [Caulobacter sp.]|nr:hypothetical protein [Caulobacter sp.]
MMGLRKLSAAGALALAMLWSGAACAQTSWVDDFKALCAGNPSDFDSAIRLAPARGFAEVPEPDDAPFRHFAKADEPNLQLLVNKGFSDDLAKANGMPTAVSRTCGVTGEGLDPVQIPALLSWVGVEPADDAPDFPKFLFRIVDGKRVSIARESDANFDAALKDGGYWFMGVSTNGPVVTATLTHIKAAP